MKRIAFLIAGLSVLARPAVAETMRFGIVIGNNLGHDPAKKLRFAEQDARKVHRVLTELGGFEGGNLHLLLGTDADEAWRIIKDIEKRLQVADQRTLLLIYYSGHAEGDLLELGKSSLRFGDLTGFLKSSRADIRLAFVDSCQSGRLVAAKGGRRGPGFDIRVNEEIDSKGYAIITSSADNELSQESAEIRGSFFTHYLVSALRGAGDHAKDGKITLQEAYRYAYSNTVARTSLTIGGSQHPMYEFKLAGQGEIVLTQTNQSRSVLSIESPTDSRLLVLNADATRVAAECAVPPSRRVALALPPGEYHAFLLSGIEVRGARVNLERGKDRRLTAADFRPHELDLAVAKGGLFRRSWSPSVQAGLLLRRMPLEGADLAVGASINLQIMAPSGLQPALRLQWTTAPDAGVSTGYHDLGALIGIGYAIPVSFVFLHGEVFAGYEHFFQSEREGSRHTSGMAYLANAGVRVPISAFCIGLAGGIGGRVFQLRDQGWTHRLDLQLFLGVGWNMQD